MENLNFVLKKSWKSHEIYFSNLRGDPGKIRVDHLVWILARRNVLCGSVSGELVRVFLSCAAGTCILVRQGSLVTQRHGLHRHQPIVRNLSQHLRAYEYGEIFVIKNDEKLRQFRITQITLLIY